MALSDAHPILQIDATQPLAVCGATLDGDQGLFDLVDTWSLVRDRLPKARLWILGDGIKGHQIWERIIDLELADSIIMPGSFDNLSDIFQAADIYVHPLRSDAGCGCLARAMAAGCCIVATNNRFTKDFITKNVNGLLTPPGNPRAMAEAICLALGDNDLRDRLGRAAQPLGIERFDVDKVVSAYLSHFGETADSVIESVNQ